MESNAKRKKSCEHKSRRSRCVICGGSEVCQHKKLKSRCVECGGSGICQHNKRKEFCLECGGSEFCVHKIRKRRCLECGGSELCEHKNHKSRCVECGGSEICEHDTRRTRCFQCKGNSICQHDKLRTRCKICDGRDLCKSTWCEKRRIEKYDNYCLTCVIHLRPDIEVSRNYKTKETHVTSYIDSEFDDFDWINDKKVKDGCSNRRPDKMCDFGSHIVIIEVDENQHTDYETSCEHKRIMEISRDLGHRPIVFIRFNPDCYINSEGKRIPSCWKVGKDGILRISDKEKLNWDKRLEKLKDVIDYWSKNVSEKTIEIVHLFYNENELE